MNRKFKFILLMIIMSGLLLGCTAKNDDEGQEDVSISKVHEKIKEELGEDYFPSMELTVDELADRTGIDRANVEEAIAEIPMMSVHVDTFIAIEAKDADAVEASLNAYHKDLQDQASNYPMNIAKVNASKVVRHGDYVFFVMLGAMDDVNDPDSSEAATFAKKENQRAIDVIDSFFN